MISDHISQSLQPISSQQKPDFKRAETPAERYAPFRVIDDPVMAMRLEKFGMNSKRSHQAFGIAQKMSGAVKIYAEPFVRIEHNGMGILNAGPKIPELRTNHRRPCPCGIDVNVKIVTVR